MNRSLTRTFSVPSDAVRAGDFAGLGADLRPALDRRHRKLHAVCEQPDSRGANRPDRRRVPPARAACHLGAPSQNLTSVEESTRDIDQFSVRVDHRLTSADQVFARFSTFDADELQPFGTSALQETLVPGFGRTLGTTTRNVAGEPHAHVRQLAAERVPFRLDEGRWRTGQPQRRRRLRADRWACGRDAGPARRRLPSDLDAAASTARWAIPTSFIFRHNQHFELYDNFTIDRGAHRFKFGGYYFHLRLRPEQPDNARGAFTYTGQFSGNAFADFLLGYPTSATSGIGRGDEDGRTNWLHLYAQDDWRMRDNLTVNVGLRYEYNQHMYDVNNRLSSIDLSDAGRPVRGGQRRARHTSVPTRRRCCR